MFELNYVLILIAGFGGGVLRGLMGFVKHQYSYKNVPFKLPHFLTMMFISGFIGLVIALVIKQTGLTFLGMDHIPPAMAFIIGYAGGDFSENIYKTIFKKPSLYSIPKDQTKE